jgi:putative transposase
MIIQAFIPAAKPGGRPRNPEMREVINAILYIVVGGVEWRMLPKEYPPGQSVYGYFSQWRKSSGCMTRCAHACSSAKGVTSIRLRAACIARVSKLPPWQVCEV